MELIYIVNRLRWVKLALVGEKVAEITQKEVKTFGFELWTELKTAAL